MSSNAVTNTHALSSLTWLKTQTGKNTRRTVVRFTSAHFSHGLGNRADRGGGQAVGSLSVFISSSRKINKPSTGFKSGQSLASGLRSIPLRSQRLIHCVCMLVFHHRNAISISSVLPACKWEWHSSESQPFYFFSWMHMCTWFPKLEGVAKG